MTFNKDTYNYAQKLFWVNYSTRRVFVANHNTSAAMIKGCVLIYATSISSALQIAEKTYEKKHIDDILYSNGLAGEH